ncbi:prolyl endopeptidase-like protein [Catenaria anguillulae PL171]|uniref:Prolyl endopeptidase n=1 Tax=Catenaria anguillulae PL171 TaxID=765915 RepID=A0A1Y2HVE1_9FUNG|nr:prolyl endopeptidase-like protein [Catenaria anguillulae PL171]
MATKPTKYTWSSYPAVRRDASVVEDLHGHKIADPYRWLEEPDSDETTAFVNAQADLTEAYLAQYPDKEKFETKLTEMFNYERYSVPFKEGSKYYYWYNTGLQNQSALYQQDSLDAEAKVFFDPNKLSDDGTIALSTYSFSESGKLFGYALSKSGSDWVTIHVMDVESGEERKGDVIEYAKFTSVEWTKDEKGFFYTRYPKVEKDDLGTETDANLFAQAYYHKLGTSQSEDVLVYQDKERPTWSGRVTESDCGKFLILSISASTAPKNKLWIARHPADGNYAEGNLDWIKIADDIDLAGFDYLTNEGQVFYFQTNLDAPRQRIVKYDLENAGAGFVEVIAEDKEGSALKYSVVVDGDKAMLVYSRDVKDVLYLYSLATGQQLEVINLPTVASIAGLSGKKKHAEMFFSFTGFLSPGTIMRYDVKDRKLSKFKETSVKGFDSDEYEAKQEFYTSKFGTKIPMFIVHRKGIKLDGSRPAFLYGYGGFSIPLGPFFSPSNSTYMKHYDAVIAIANLRGGGEYGEDWHHDGMLNKKQNVFDDFQWAAKHLVARGYTSHSKLAINGGSNGGLLVGACINQAPELFAAAVAQVGVLDMYRFHKFTIGHAWTADYGNPDKKEDFEYLTTYSPLHTIKTQTYPATLLMTSDHDDRVVPLHSYKYAAELQYKNPKNPNPLLILIERKAGHGAGKPTKKRIESEAWKFAFIAMNTGAEWRD